MFSSNPLHHLSATVCKFAITTLLFVWVPSVYGGCPNACSGHGLCAEGAVCECFPGWITNQIDCSQSKFHATEFS
jgi:hypothetical protein